MDLSWIWHAILIFIVGTIILRIGGRKSISQMTIGQTIVMIGLGSLLIQPVSGKGLLVTFAVALLLTLLLVITEYIEIKVDILETVFSGKAVIVIENGEVNIKNLKKLRLSIDKLETRLRQAGISSIDDVQYATIEVSGQLGYELKDHKKPLTKGDLMMLMEEISLIKQAVRSGMGYDPNLNQNLNLKSNQNQNQNQNQNNIFSEINSKMFEGNKKEP